VDRAQNSQEIEAYFVDSCCSSVLIEAEEIGQWTKLNAVDIDGKQSGRTLHGQRGKEKHHAPASERIMARATPRLGGAKIR
jgi:hypothetical protein